MSKLFISHSSKDERFVRELQQALTDLKQEVWTVSRDVLPGGLLDREIKQAIDGASAFVVVVSPDALQSEWVGKELRYALKLQDERGRDKFPVIPLSIDGTRLGALEELFSEGPIYIPVSSSAGGIGAAIHLILVTLGMGKQDEMAAAPEFQIQPLEELVLELTDLKFQEQDGKRRASARAQLVYEPATPGRQRRSQHGGLAFRGTYRADRGGGTALVSGKVCHLAEQIFPRSRAQG